eukprot:12435613-Alexandrium_andersonii.AAC.1
MEIGDSPARIPSLQAALARKSPNCGACGRKETNKLPRGRHRGGHSFGSLCDIPAHPRGAAR